MGESKSKSNKFKTEDGKSFSANYTEHGVDEARFNVDLDGKPVGYLLEDDEVRAYVDPAAVGAGFGVAREIGSFKDRKDATQAIVDAVAAHLGE